MAVALLVFCLVALQYEVVQAATYSVGCINGWSSYSGGWPTHYVLGKCYNLIICSMKIVVTVYILVTETTWLMQNITLATFTHKMSYLLISNDGAVFVFLYFLHTNQ